MLPRESRLMSVKPSTFPSVMLSSSMERPSAVVFEAGPSNYLSAGGRGGVLLLDQSAARIEEPMLPLVTHVRLEQTSLRVDALRTAVVDKIRRVGFFLDKIAVLVVPFFGLRHPLGIHLSCVSVKNQSFEAQAFYRTREIIYLPIGLRRGIAVRARD